jgi:hypothetical protein
MRLRIIKRALERLETVASTDLKRFGLPSGGMVYLTLGQVLRGFGEAKDGPVSYEAQVILNAAWSDCPQLYALAHAWRHPVDTTEGGHP